MRRWLAKYRNRRAYWKVGKAYLYLSNQLPDKSVGGWWTDRCATLDLLSNVLTKIDTEYYSI